MTKDILSLSPHEFLCAAKVGKPVNKNDGLYLGSLFVPNADGGRDLIAFSSMSENLTDKQGKKTEFSFDAAISILTSSKGWLDHEGLRFYYESDVVNEIVRLNKESKSDEYHRRVILGNYDLTRSGYVREDEICVQSLFMARNTRSFMGTYPLSANGSGTSDYWTSEIVRVRNPESDELFDPNLFEDPPGTVQEWKRAVVEFASNVGFVRWVDHHFNWTPERGKPTEARVRPIIVSKVGLGD
ncbi:MAG: hypothetical protein WC521_02700 [Bdellovibrionales bacterium]|jgi:hypothetical protein